MFFNKINMNTVRKNNMPGMQTDIRMEIKKKKIIDFRTKWRMNIYMCVYKRRILYVYLFLTIKRFNLILRISTDILLILIYSTKYYLVSCLDVAFRLYQHLDDLRISSRCCPMNWRSSILNHFPVQNVICVSSISLDIILTRRLYAIYFRYNRYQFSYHNSKLIFRNVYT